MIRVLLVEDSPAVLQLLQRILESDPGIQVAGTASDGEQAIEAARRLRPDVITMDIHMPVMNGLEATRTIMETDPRPIVIVSGSSDPQELATTFEAMEAGALAVLGRPEGIGHEDHERTARELIRTVKAMAEVKVVRRWRNRSAPKAKHPAAPRAAPDRPPLVAIGASTGGPPALNVILAGLPADFPAAIAIVQHMAPGFVAGFVEWLGRSTSLPVRLASQGMKLQSGNAYLAPDGYQMAVTPNARFDLSRCAEGNGPCPSVSHFFRSVVEAYGGSAIAGLLSGMGRDGADELLVLKEQGAATFAQDEKSSVVHGMPGEAIRLDAARYVLAPEELPAILTALARRGR